MTFPGVQETLMGIGMNDAICDQLEKFTSRRFALNTYANFLLQYGVTVMKASVQDYYAKMDEVFNVAKSSQSSQVSEDELKMLINEFKSIQHVPTDPWEQLNGALLTMYSTWYGERAVRYRTEILDLPSHQGVALCVQEMLFGGK
jgi:phosphoenolpyruvate synthase/pyruvate phosphate dikinase